MALIPWQERFAVGIASVDHEHRGLIDLINRLAEVLDRDGGEESAVAFFGDLRAAIAAHFALEERTMREARYAELAPHKADHERLLDDLADLADDCERGGIAAGARAALRARLEDWFGLHFRTHDARLHGIFTPSNPGGTS
ncbi:MAG: bacteriohemerythrin [Alphaproteobacteria bacterium]|nr:bacteriohemerythrin [Alphaproteobacteria bacterium]